MVLHPVADWFDRKAADYEAASTRWPWRSLRDAEARAVLDALGPVRGHRVLELGCGAGHYTRRLLDEGAEHVVAVDVSEAMLAQLPAARVTAHHADASTLDLPERFDRLLSAGMLEFVEEPVRALRRAAEHASPDARLAVLAPRDGMAGRTYQRWHRGHDLDVHLFRHDALATALEAAGWTVDAVRPAGLFALVASARRTP